MPSSILGLANTHTHTRGQVSQTLSTMAEKFTPSSVDADAVIDRILVLAGERKKVEQAEIPEFFTPATGKWKMKCKVAHPWKRLVGDD